MCGICGIVSHSREELVTPAQLQLMRDCMVHRGPDDQGSYVEAAAALASRRLSVLDLSERGRMPMQTPDNRYRIVHNGEIYNYRELRASLEKKQHRFLSDTDTEVLLHLYAEYGAEMLPLLNGMFAFAIWDTHDRTLFIARDRQGIKPLYYAVYSGKLYFASEEKALFVAGVPFQFDPETWLELLYFRYVTGERTPFIGVKRLLPGHYMLCQDGTISLHRWWNLSERAAERRESLPQDLSGWYQETFDDSIRLRRISDVPIGVLLSGGLDSSTVAAALALQTSDALKSFTVSFTEDGYDESPMARDVATQWHLDYLERKVRPDELFSLVQDASWFNDEPLVHGNDAHMLAIAQHAKPRVTVLLSGEGADETLGGYVRYRPLHYLRSFSVAHIPAKTLRKPLLKLSRSNHRLNKLIRFLALNRPEDFVLFNACDVLPGDFPLREPSDGQETWDYRHRVFAEAKRLYPGDPLRQAMYLDQHTFMCSLFDRNDRMTMGASIECRVPFLDYRLVETVAGVPTDKLISRAHNKHLLRESLGDRLPESVRTHAKWGFGVPWHKYLREVAPFPNIVRELPGSELIENSPLNPGWLAAEVAAFFKGNDRQAILLRQLVMVQIWHDTYKDRLFSLNAEAHA